MEKLPKLNEEFQPKTAFDTARNREAINSLIDEVEGLKKTKVNEDTFRRDLDNMTAVLGLLRKLVPFKPSDQSEGKVSCKYCGKLVDRELSGHYCSVEPSEGKVYEGWIFDGVDKEVEQGGCWCTKKCSEFSEDSCIKTIFNCNLSS